MIDWTKKTKNLSFRQINIKHPSNNSQTLYNQRSTVKSNLERCFSSKCNGKIAITTYTVPNHIWNLVTNSYKKTICLKCFDIIATKKNIDYKPYLTNLTILTEDDLKANDES